MTEISSFFLNEIKEMTSERENRIQHDFYKTSDDDAPDAIRDRNGEVCLACCRVCGQAEIELTDYCPGEPENE